MTSRHAPAWLGAVLLTLVVGGTAASAPARAQDACDGVRVVVDASGLGGDVSTRCAAGDPSSGLDALQRAGHTYTFVPRQPGLVCTIDARPDPCNGAPQDAYWSYWHAPAGGDWTYATRGAGNRDPEPGTVEGWAFGAGDPPRQAPPATAPAGAEPEPTAPAPAEDPEPAAPREGSASTDDGPDDAADRDGTTGTDGSGRDAPDPGTEPTGAATVASPLASPSDPSAGPTGLDAPPGPLDPTTSSPTPAPVGSEVTTGDDRGAPVGLLAGGVLVVGLAAAGLRRSRRHGDG